MARARRRETDEEFLQRMVDGKLLAPRLIAQFATLVGIVRRECKAHAWRARPAVAVSA